ncbi:hypothetical protein N018_11175 [Pseudomonas syringae CC1557]|uniref:Uncharacterized protein n=1 Tax=Pseudomonas syringae CC1557 TaxID=1357279 RepID=W0MY94_PSESX|nr:hypothetical protein [Pseudomonas syringae]AHG43554.1 hypothetical protein N018_11175 [Pseudomonas syringae CC1557]
MKNFAYYAGLPDFMTSKDVNAELLELLGSLGSRDFNIAEFVKSLLELSDRQWHTYDVLDASLKERIEQCLISIWDGHDLELAEDVIDIMVRLGLERISAFLGSRSLRDVSPEVFNEISLALSELGGSVSDPYSGMR